MLTLITGPCVSTDSYFIVADLLLFCYKRYFMKSLTNEKRYHMIAAFNSTSRCLDDLLNIEYIHFEHMVNRMYPAE